LYRKIQADHIFDGYRLLPSDRVLIVNDDGTVVDLVSAATAGEGIEHYKGIVCPGLINCHCHTELSHLKGQIPEKTGLIGFITAVMEKRTEDLETIEAATRQAIEEMRKNGIVAVGDICNQTHSIVPKTASTLHFHNFIEVSGFPVSVAQKRWTSIQQVAQSFATAGLSYSMVPHAPYSVSTELLQMVIGSNQGQPITIHNQEAFDENELFLYGKGGFPDFYRQWGISMEGFEPSGKSSWRTLLPYFNTQQPLLMVHNVHTEINDLEDSLSHYREDLQNLFICLCPNANEYISGQLPDINLLMQKEMQLVLGTDSLASNHQLDLLSEMRTLQSRFQSLTFEEMLKWATSNGARALKINNQYGSFEKGKQPGVILINIEKVEKIII